MNHRKVSWPSTKEERAKMKKWGRPFKVEHANEDESEEAMSDETKLEGDDKILCVNCVHCHKDGTCYAPLPEWVHDMLTDENIPYWTYDHVRGKSRDECDTFKEKKR